jgi:hypothetical protein
MRARAIPLSCRITPFNAVSPGGPDAELAGRLTGIAGLSKAARATASRSRNVAEGNLSHSLQWPYKGNELRLMVVLERDVDTSEFTLVLQIGLVVAA